MQFQISLEGKTGKEIPESSRLEFIEKFSANNFALSDAEEKTSGLLAIRQKSREPSFQEVMDSCFISICKFGSLKCDEMGHPVVNQLEKQWKLRQQHNQNF